MPIICHQPISKIIDRYLESFVNAIMRIRRQLSLLRYVYAVVYSMYKSQYNGDADNPAAFNKQIIKKVITNYNLSSAGLTRFNSCLRMLMCSCAWSIQIPINHETSSNWMDNFLIFPRACVCVCWNVCVFKNIHALQFDCLLKQKPQPK